MLAHAHVIARDADGCVTFWSATDEEIYGWSAQEALGRKIAELLRTELPEPREQLEARASAEGKWEGEIVQHRRDGSRLTLSTTWTPHYDEAGALVMFVEVNCDITRLKEIEREFRTREREFRSFFELTGVGNVLTDATTGRFLTVNDTYCEMTGYSRTELASLTADDITHPDERDEDAAGWRRSLARGDTHFSMEKRYVRKDRSVLWVAVTSTIIRDDAGQPLRAASVVIDASARRQALEAEAEAREKLERRVAERTEELHRISAALETVIEASPAAVIAIDDARHVEIWNPEAEHLFGLATGEVRGRRLLDLPLSWSSPDQLDALLDMPAGDQATLSVQTSQGRELEVSIWCAPYSPRGGAKDGRVLLVLDETEKKFLEHALLQSGEREQRRIGEELHEGLCQQLLGAAFGAQALFKELDRTKSPSAGRAGDLARLINDSVKDARNLARGINPVEIDSAGLMSALQELAERAGPGVEIELRCAKLVLVHSAETALHVFRIAQEAVTNALRHSRARHIVIRLAEDDGNSIVLQVSDDGVDVPLPTENDAGVGIGIMKYRAQAIHGQIDISPTATGGTLVTCTFPNR
jgi:PAS domain S-box-containing protein